MGQIWKETGKTEKTSPLTPHTRIRRRCFPHNRSRIEAGTLLYPLFGFYLAVAVQVGTEVAVAAKAAFCRDNRATTALRAPAGSVSENRCGYRQDVRAHRVRLRSRCPNCGRCSRGHAHRAVSWDGASLYRRSCGCNSDNLRRRSPGAGGLLSSHVRCSYGHSG